jgi:hypothetical protein
MNIHANGFPDLFDMHLATAPDGETVLELAMPGHAAMQFPPAMAGKFTLAWATEEERAQLREAGFGVLLSGDQGGKP